MLHLSLRFPFRMYIRRLRITKLTFRIILSLFLYNSIGYFFIFKCVQADIRQQVAEQMQLQPFYKNLKAIAFDKHDVKKINWIEEEKEMRYQGELYDVAKTIETPDSVIYYCRSDEDEDQLYHQLDDHITNHVLLPTNTPASKKVAPEPVKLYFSTEHHSSFNLFVSSRSPVFVFSAFLPVYIEMDAPPPKFA
jgi:hypothetical protein